MDEDWIDITTVDSEFQIEMSGDGKFFRHRRIVDPMQNIYTEWRNGRPEQYGPDGLARTGD